MNEVCIAIVKFAAHVLYMVLEFVRELSSSVDTFGTGFNYIKIPFMVIVLNLALLLKVLCAGVYCCLARHKKTVRLAPLQTNCKN